MTQNVPIGSVSHATQRPQDLIPTFARFLAEHDREKLSEVYQRYSEEIREGSLSYRDTVECLAAGDFDDDSLIWQSETASYFLDDLFDALNDIAPPFVYFGAHEGDGSDYGFWLDFYSLEEAVEDEVVRKVDDLSELEDSPGEEDYVLLVNDHGNMALYRWHTEGDGGLIPVWEVV